MKYFLEHLENQVAYARAYHETWRAMTGSAMLPAYKDAFNNNVYLARTLEASLASSFVIALCTIFDNGKDAISLRRLAHYTRLRDGELPAPWEKRFKNLGKRVNKLITLRNQAFAHRLDTLLTRNVFQEAGYSNRDLSEIMDETWSLTVELYQIYGDLTPQYFLRPLEDLKRLFPKMDPERTWN